MKPFIFQSYDFDEPTRVASFRYQYDGHEYCERLIFGEIRESYDQEIFDRVLFFAFILIGTSYYKAFPTNEISINQGDIDEWQAGFFTHVYQEGLSQYAYENGLKRSDLAHFSATCTRADNKPLRYDSKGVLSLQSGGKDSLLVGRMLRQHGVDFTSLYVTSTHNHPDILDQLGAPVVLTKRAIDKQALREAARAGGRNGHVPVTFIVLATGLIQAVLRGDNIIIAGIGHEGEEPHAWVGDLPVNHQWSKTWSAELLFAEYVNKYISPDIRVGSIIRQYSELEITKRFSTIAWREFGHKFSSCNVANYGQGKVNTTLGWCGQCPKCANSYLLFSPFIAASELRDIFGHDLYEDPELVDTFKGLLGVDNVMKPFECVGEVDELRAAYHDGIKLGDYTQLPFSVPVSMYDETVKYPSQDILSLD